MDETKTEINYKKFDNDMNRIREIEQELKELNSSGNISLEKVMNLRNEAAELYTYCNNVLDSINKTNNK